jgi:excisionase family DNA binding protein
MGAHPMKTHAHEDRLITPAEAAELLATTVKALDHRRRSGDIPFVPLGRLVRYRQSTIQAFIEEHEIRLAPRRRGRPSKVTPFVTKGTNA